MAVTPAKKTAAPDPVKADAVQPDSTVDAPPAPPAPEPAAAPKVARHARKADGAEEAAPRSPYAERVSGWALDVAAFVQNARDAMADLSDDHVDIITNEAPAAADAAAHLHVRRVMSTIEDLSRVLGLVGSTAGDLGAAAV